MKQISTPPDWKSLLTPKLLQKALRSSELQNLVKHADVEYVHWDKFRHFTSPKGLSIEESWAYLKFSRSSRRNHTPAQGALGDHFSYTITKNMFHKLSFIDSNASGLLTSAHEESTEKQRNQLILSGLSEEAIASSQIEGANTSRKVAKHMLQTGRKPRTRDEQMIINNYLAMQQLQDWKDLDLSSNMLLDIQRTITNNTLEDPIDSGRFRKDIDNIIVGDRLTGEIIFTPPPEDIMLSGLKNLISYANTSEQTEDFTHPLIKASILHFWLAYLHPFVDGNGRTARAIFYWYLLKHKYWLFQYLSVSRVIKTSRTQYDYAYLKTESDELDLTYFISYQLKSIEQAIHDFREHYRKKLREDKKLSSLADKLTKFNDRQIALLTYLSIHPDSTIDIKTHQSTNQVVYQTARTDLFFLEHQGLITHLTDGRKYVFLPNLSAIKKLLSKK